MKLVSFKSMDYNGEVYINLDSITHFYPYGEGVLIYLNKSNGNANPIYIVDKYENVVAKIKNALSQSS